MAENDITKTTIDVTSSAGISYVFAIPNMAQEIQLGIRERNIRRELDPGGNGDPSGLDDATFLMVRAAAQFEMLLRKCSDQWPFTTGKDGKPVIDYKNFPSDKLNEAIQVSLMFQADLNRFRSGGVDDANAQGTEIVEGKPDTGK